jgi:dihydrolipoamide dehydrogenase
MLFPSCVYGDPEVASAGLTEEEASAAGRKVRVGEFRFLGNGRAGSMGKEEGEVIIVSDSQTGEVLGVHMIGPQVTELISLATLAMRNGIDVAGIKKTVFPHPGLSEAFFEAALATDGEAIHMKIERDAI